MRQTTLTAIAALFGILLQSAAADACSSIKASAQLEMFQCMSCARNSDTLESSILTLSGSLVLSNRRAAPELASLVIELDAKIGNTFVPVARRVLNEAGDEIVENCEGLFADDALPGRLALVDGAGNPISFTSVKNLPEGRIALRYVASFGGAIPGLDPGSKLRVRTLATAINADAPRTCSIDANNDGSTDFSVKTHVTRSTVQMPATILALMP